MFLSFSSKLQLELKLAATPQHCSRLIPSILYYLVLLRLRHFHSVSVLFQSSAINEVLHIDGILILTKLASYNIL